MVKAVVLSESNLLGVPVLALVLQRRDVVRSDSNKVWQAYNRHSGRGGRWRLHFCINFLHFSLWSGLWRDQGLFFNSLLRLVVWCVSAKSLGSSRMLDIYSHYLIDSVAQWFRALAYIVGGRWFDSSPCHLSFPKVTSDRFPTKEFNIPS